MYSISKTSRLHKMIFVSTLCLLCLSPTTWAANLAALWEFDGDFTDTTGSFSGFNQGSVTFVQGQVGQAASFDGGSASVSNPNAVDNVESFNSIASSSFTSGLSVMGWTKFDSDGSGGTVLSHDKSTGCCSQVGFNFSIDSSGGLNLFMRDTADRRLFASSTTSISADTFHHVAVTWNGSTTGGIKMYIDGQEVGTSIGTINSFTGLNGGALPFRVGASSGDSASNFAGFDGAIDHLSVWNGALTTNEVEVDFNDGSVPEPASALLLVCAVFFALGRSKKK